MQQEFFGGMNETRLNSLLTWKGPMRTKTVKKMNEEKEMKQIKKKTHGGGG